MQNKLEQKHLKKAPTFFNPSNKRKRYFLSSVLIVGCIIGSVMSWAIIGGAINAYNIPFSDWSTQTIITQVFMITIYTTVFTLFLSVPLWYYFLGNNDH